jgi:hypothetical protein
MQNQLPKALVLGAHIVVRIGISLLTILAPLLEQTANSPDEKRTQLHARLASAGRDPSLVEPLVEELLTGKLTYVGPIRELLKPRSSQLSDTFWQVLRDETGDSDRRFRAGLALAEYSPPSESDIDTASKSESDSSADWESKSWTEPLFSFMAQQLVSANAEFQPMLRGLLVPIKARLLPELERIFESTAANDAQRLSAANAFADYAASDVGKLSTLLEVATKEQYDVIYPLVAANPTPSVSRYTNGPTFRSSAYGFRLALSPSSQVPAEPEAGEAGAE